MHLTHHYITLPSVFQPCTSECVYRREQIESVLSIPTTLHICPLSHFHNIRKRKKKKGKNRNRMKNLRQFEQLSSCVYFFERKKDGSYCVFLDCAQHINVCVSSSEIWLFEQVLCCVNSTFAYSNNVMSIKNRKCYENRQSFPLISQQAGCCV